MIDIEQKAINTFQKNYTYFASSHASLHKKIDILQSAIESKQYAENYSLEYANGYFDLKELSSGQLLYGSSSIKHAQETAKNVNLKKNESVIETFYNFPYTQANIEDLDKLTIINSHMTGTAPIVRFVNEHTSPTDEMKKIFKFIFFGVGIGQHLTAVNEKIHADSYLIVEDNLELFRLSMFVTDYEALGKIARLFFSIMDTPGEFKHTYNLFAEDMLIRNSHLKFYLLSDSYAPKIKHIQNFAVTKSHLIYPYNYLLHKNLLVSHAIHENYNFLNISKPFESSPFSDKPLLYLAAGPSLNAHINWIKEHQESFVIVAVFMITVKLQKAGICPDIVVHVDEGREPVESTLAKMTSKNFLKESIFILAASAPLELFSLISKKEKVFLIEDRTRYKKDHGFIEFFSVGEVGYALSLIFGAKDIYLLGLDLALDQKTGRTHAEGHSTHEKVDIEKGDTGPEKMASLRDTLIKVRGNKQEYVFTTPLFDTSIHQLNRLTKIYKQAFQNVYNLSNGAYFDESMAIEINTVQVNLLDKDATRETLYDYLKNTSTDHLSTIEKNNIIIRKNEVKRKAKLIERFSKSSIKNDEELRKQLLGLIGSLIKNVNPELNEVSEIFLSYFQTVGNYIGNYLNTDSLQKPNKEVIELQQILSQQLYKILHGIGSLDFNYINGNKYFDTKEVKSFQNKILDFNIRSLGFSQIDEICFVEGLSSQSVDRARLKNLYYKDAIGFMAVEENLYDKDFIDYIKELYSRFPEITLKAFYFNDGQKKLIEKVLENELDRCELIVPREIYDIADQVEIYVWSLNYSLDLKIAKLFISFSNKVVPAYNFYTGAFKISRDLTLHEYDVVAKSEDVMNKKESFNFTEKEILDYGNCYIQLVYQTKFNKIPDLNYTIDMNMNAVEFMCFKQVEIVLNHAEYKDLITKFYKIRSTL